MAAFVFSVEGPFSFAVQFEDLRYSVAGCLRLGPRTLSDCVPSRRMEDLPLKPAS